MVSPKAAMLALIGSRAIWCLVPPAQNNTATPQPQNLPVA